MINQLACTFFLTGLIWIVQLVHYPAFKFIDKENFKQFQQFHTQNITWIVAPAMVLELLFSVLLFLKLEDFFSILNVLSVLLIWVATFFVSVPIHNKLQNGYDLKLIKKLVQTNWLRTVLWTMRSVGLFYYFNSSNFL